MSEKSISKSLVDLLLLAFSLCGDHMVSSHSILFIPFVTFSVMGFFFSVYELSDKVRLAWRWNAGVSNSSRSHSGHNVSGHIQYILQYVLRLR
jgi:hypothetical protein